jgi:TetR/AcrR family transcriptional repressor of nem operon
MRMSREAMARHHEEIVAAAARLLRERGVEGTSVADLMQGAGLTHGGFYRHFGSKEELVAEASEAAFAAMLDSIKARLEKQGPAEGLKSYVSRYLSTQHVKGPGSGCPVAAFGSEAARAGADVQRIFAERIGTQIDTLATGLEGGAAERKAKAMRLLAMLVGAVVIARAAGDGRIGVDVLKACREAFDNAPSRKR